MSKVNSLMDRLKAAQTEKDDSRKPLAGSFAGIVDSFEPYTSDRTGTQGYKIVYKLTGASNKGKLIFDYLMMTRKDGSPIPFSERKLLSRLTTFGITVDQINTFRLPSVEGDESDLDKTVGAKVKLELEIEESADGTVAYQRVKNVKAAE